MKSLLAIFLALLFLLGRHKPEINFLYGTVIVVVLSPRCVVIGADSRGTNYKANGEKEFLELCKITPVGNYYYALAGFYYSTRMNLKNTIEKELQENNDFDEAVQNIKREMTSILFDEYKYLKENQPIIFKERTTKGTMVTEIAIVGLRNGRPFAQMIGVDIINNETCEMSTREKLVTSGNKVLYLGETRQIREAMESFEKNGTRFNEPAYANYLLDLEIKGGDSSIGWPVDILEIKPNEKIWHKKKGNCPE
jgi:hypothetical protein